MPSDPIEIPRPAHRVSIDLMGKRYALDVSIKPLPDKLESPQRRRRAVSQK